MQRTYQFLLKYSTVYTTIAQYAIVGSFYKIFSKNLFCYYS